MLFCPISSSFLIHSWNFRFNVLRRQTTVKAVFHCSRFAHPGEATDFNSMKNQSRGHAKKVKCSVVKLPSVSARTKADRKRSCRLDTHSKVETCSLCPLGQNDCNGKLLKVRYVLIVNSLMPIFSLCGN